MRWKYPDWRERSQRWRRAFALIPVRIHDEIVWMEFYWYRGTSVACDRARTIAEQANPYSLVSY